MDTTSPVELVNQLDPDEIRARLSDLHNEAAALRILLRAAQARQRNQARRSQPDLTREEGPDHAQA